MGAMLAFDCVQGFAPINVYPTYEIDWNILISHLNGAYPTYEIDSKYFNLSFKRCLLYESNKKTY